ncbi:MAG: PD-(D/E)XK nuclease family protein [bacterium]
MKNLIITTNQIKKELLLKRSEDKVISNDIIMTKREIESLILGSVKKEGIVFLTKEFNIPLTLARVYVKNLLYKHEDLKKYYDSLLNNGFIEIFVKPEYESIKLINVELDEYICSYFKGVEIKKEDKESLNLNHQINLFDKSEEEIVWIAQSIIKNKYDLTKVKLVNVPEEYKLTIDKIFSMYNIPINIIDEVTILKTDVCSLFLSNLEKSRNVEESLSSIQSGEVYNKIVTYFNSTNFDEITDEVLEYVKYDLKNITLSKKKKKNAVNCINIDDIYNKDDIYFFVALNDSVPRKYKDEDFYPDNIKKDFLKVFTSSEKNKNGIKMFMNIYENYENLYFSYSSKSTFQRYNPSTLIKDYSLEVVKVNESCFTFSNLHNKVTYASMLDEYIKFGVISDNLIYLNGKYNIEYMNYSNKFTSIDTKYLKYPLTLSYSSLKTYNECNFKYYIDKILRLNLSETSLSIHIGNVYHNVLSLMFEDDFDFSSSYDAEVNKLDITFKERFFLMNLKEELSNILDFLYEFNDQTSLKTNLCENEFIIEDIIEGKLNFKGYIDLIKYDEKTNLAALFDYKTGTVEATLDNVNYGLNLQLPSYLYLLSEKYPDLKVIGMYLDRILDKPSVDATDKDIRTKLKFVGYSTTNESELELLDSTYVDSNYIKSLKMTKNGFSSYSKVLDENNFIKIRDIAKNVIKTTGENILSANFDINPIELKSVEKCKYCKYKDLCYMTNEDVVYKEESLLKDLL